jgi:hypothetical protein
LSGYEVHLPIRRPILAAGLALLFIPWWDYSKFSGLLIRGIVRPESGVEFFFCLALGTPFLLFFAGFGGGLLYLILLNLIGTETLRVESGQLRLRQSLCGIGRWKSFPVGHLTDLRTGGMEFWQELLKGSERKDLKDLLHLQKGLTSAAPLMAFLGIRPGLVFRAKKQVRWFGSGLDELYAREILARLRMHLPEGAFTVSGKPGTLLGD